MAWMRRACYACSCCLGLKAACCSFTAPSLRARMGIRRLTVCECTCAMHAVPCALVGETLSTSITQGARNSSGVGSLTVDVRSSTVNKSYAVQGAHKRTLDAGDTQDMNQGIWLLRVARAGWLAHAAARQHAASCNGVALGSR